MSALNFYPTSSLFAEHSNSKKVSIRKMVVYLFSTKRNHIIDMRIEKINNSLPRKVWNEMNAVEQVTYTYHRAAILRAIYRLEQLKN